MLRVSISTLKSYYKSGSLAECVNKLLVLHRHLGYNLIITLLHV